MTEEDGIRWDLDGCCDQEEILFISFYGVYLIMTLLLWQQPMLKPLKLLAVLIHELGHGTAAVLTCGRMQSITVNGDESGLASYSGGIQVRRRLRSVFEGVLSDQDPCTVHCHPWWICRRGILGRCFCRTEWKSDWSDDRRMSDIICIGSCPGVR